MSLVYPDDPAENVTCSVCGLAVDVGPGGCTCDDDLDPEPWDDPSWDERHTARFVIPIWKDQRDDEDSQDLHECASCSQFFVTGIPLRMFLGEGRERGQCLSFCVCDDCTPYVLKAHGTSTGAAS